MPSFLDRLVTPLGRALRNRHAGDAASVRHLHGLASSTDLALSSTSFENGGVLDDRHSSLGRGPNVSPSLSWDPVPAGTAQLLFVLEDVDVPMARPSIHTAGFFPPSVTFFAEGELTADNPQARWIPRMGRTGYMGPRPLPGHGPHRYHFLLYALDIAVPKDAAITSLTDALPLVAGHVLASGLITGVQTG